MTKKTLLEFRLRLNRDVTAYHLKGYEDTFFISIESLARFPIDAHWDIISVKEYDKTHYCTEFFCEDEDLGYSSKKCKEQCSGCKWIESL